MQIVSGPIGYETVHYEAPPSSQIPKEMALFLKWYNVTNPLKEGSDKIPGPVRAAIAHLWFESIHPFDDGNGRIGRAIAEHALAQDLGHPPLLSLSTEIEKNRKAYLNALHNASRPDMDITLWIKWFVAVTKDAQLQAKLSLDHVLQKTRFWEIHESTQLNDRQVKAINKIFSAGPSGFEFGVNAQKYQGLTNCSKATATRDLASLVEKGCIQKKEGTKGRNTRYEIVLPDVGMGL